MSRPLDPRDDADELLTVPAVCAALHIARSTFYTIRFFRERFVRVGKRGMRIRRGDLRLYIHLQHGERAA